METFDNLKQYLPQERAKKLYDMRSIDGNIPRFFLLPSDLTNKALKDDGMTREEYDVVMRFWKTKPGSWRFSDAFMCFVRGKDET